MSKTALPKRKASFHSFNKIALLTQFDLIPPYNQPAKWVQKILTHFVGGTEYYYGFTRFNFAKERIVLDAAGLLFLCACVSDQYGRKKGTLVFCIIYAIDALSTKSPLLSVLLLGRVVSGVGTALLFSAPESWLVGAAQKSGDDPDGKYLGEMFGLAYAGDAIVAIVAGQLASLAAARSGPTGPFELSSGVLGVGFLLAALLWEENRSASKNENEAENFAAVMLTVATLAMPIATWAVKASGSVNLAILAAAFFAFEACVGMYFPSIGALPSKCIPDSRRSVVMNLFGIPLNFLVVSVFLSINKLGRVGALAVSTGAS